MEQHNRRHMSLGVFLLFLLAGVYVGSYCLLVNPWGETTYEEDFTPSGNPRPAQIITRHFSRGGAFAEVVYWPLMQIDKRLRPHEWLDEFEIR